MVTPIVFSTPLLAIALGLLAMHYARRLRADREQLFAQSCRAEHDRAQAQAELVLARAELARVREKRHAHPTVEMLDDLGSILLDIDGETRQFARYILGRLKNADRTLAAGRPGPYAYTPTTTDQRPPRPGADVRLWKR